MRSTTVSGRGTRGQSPLGGGSGSGPGRQNRATTIGPSPLGSNVISSEIPLPKPNQPIFRQENAVTARSAPTSLQPSPVITPTTPNHAPLVPKRSTLRQVASTIGLRASEREREMHERSRTQDSYEGPSPTPSSAQSLSRPESSQSRREGRPSPKLVTPNAMPVRRPSQRSQIETKERFNSIETTRSTELSHHSDHASPISPTNRTPSLRSRISFSHLRGKSTRSIKEPSEPSYSAPNTPIGQHELEEETVQVKDMEFELIKPVIRHRDVRRSEDSHSPDKDNLSLRGDLRPEAESHRSLSPAVSARSPDPRSPAASSVDSFGTGKLRRPTVDPMVAHAQAQEANKEAHRARELKWMTTLSAIPSSQAGKSKKVRKLLNDPVPDSVRYLAWAHVLDAKSRRTDNVYPQMVKKGAAGAGISDQVSADVEKCFVQHAHLCDPKGPVYSLVMAYAAMVPDVKYSMGKFQNVPLEMRWLTNFI
jgi:hypothetical protein